MEIAPSLITLYDKYVSADREHVSIRETETAEVEDLQPNRTHDTNSSIGAQPGTTDIRQTCTEHQDDVHVAELRSPDAGSDFLINSNGIAVVGEPVEIVERTQEVSCSTTPPLVNQSFLYNHLTSVAPVSEAEQESTDERSSHDNERVKLRSESCPGILDTTDETEEESTKSEIEIERQTNRTETKPKSFSLDKYSHIPKRKTSATSPPERADTNANLRGFQRTLSFGARLARTKFSQFIESNALGKSKGDQSSANKKSSPEASVKPRQRLRSGSEPAATMFALRQEPKRKSSRINPTILSMVEAENGAMSPTPSPAATPPSQPRMACNHQQTSSRLSLSYMDQKSKELLDTEESYVMHLADIIAGYKCPMSATVSTISHADQDILFGNIQEIHTFNSKLLLELLQCNSDAVLIAECFLDNEKKFTVYTDYCTNYPSTVEVLMDCMKHRDVVEFFKECQQCLGHPLPLGAYLLKPVQRVLKYHLLFQDMYKHFNKDDDGYDTIGDALDCMTDIACYINEMKRKHEAAVHVQEIQSQLIGWEGDLMSSGELVLEDVFRMQGARAERYLYLFEKVLLIGKKREDGLISVKTHIPSSNLMLIESLQKEPLGFNVIPFNNPSIQYTILARNVEQKKLWSHEIKRLILENYGSTIPTKVKELILRNTAMSSRPESDKEVMVDLDQAREKKERKSRRQKRRNSEPMGKLIRGQKQVKAAVESMLAKGMKKPELSRWDNRRASNVHSREENTSDDSDNDELKSSRRLSSLLDGSSTCGKSSLLVDSDSTPDSRNTSKQSYADVVGQRLSGNSLELDSNVSSTHSDEEKDQHTPPERTNLIRTRESNRDSGIGSMTLSEHASVDGDQGSQSRQRRTDIANKNTITDPIRKRLGLEDSEEEGNSTEKPTEDAESPDELEALESLPETTDNIASGGFEDTVKCLPSDLKKASPSEPFKLRHNNIRTYRPLDAHKNGDVWIPMSSGAYMRSRSASYGARPLSVDIAMHNPHQKLARSNSDDRHMLNAISEMYNRSHSDPNMLDFNANAADYQHTGNGIEDRSRSESNIPTQTHLLDNFQVSLCASGETSTLSSNENLLESVNSAFQKLEEKYSDFHPSDNEDKENDVGRPEEATDDCLDGGVEVPAPETVPIQTKSDIPQPQVKVQPPKAPPKTVMKLAREFSRKSKESPKLVVTRHVFSDPYLGRDGTTHMESFSMREDDSGHIVVSAKRDGKITKHVETFQRALTEDETWQAPQRTRVRHISDSVFPAMDGEACGSSPDEDDQLVDLNKPSKLRQIDVKRQSVRDVVKTFERATPTKKEFKMVTPTVVGIKERLQAIRQNAEFHKQSSQVTNAKLKSLQERREELKEWVSRPILRRYNKSEGSYPEFDSGSQCSTGSDEQDGLSSYGSSRASSATASPVHAAKASLHLAGLTSLNDDQQMATDSKEPAVLFRSLKERCLQLEKAVSKPIPRTCVDPQEEIKATKESGTDQGEDPPPVETEKIGSRGSPSKTYVNSVFLEPKSCESLYRAVSCESNYTDARSELSPEESSEDSFHSGYATPTES